MNKLFLGIDGGQSHTEAVVADELGNILGIGFGGALDHGNSHDGREKLKNSLNEAITNALKDAEILNVKKINFAAAHCGLTGGADFKEEIVRKVIKSENLVVGHDALTALFGATGGKPGIVVIAGTGSIVFGVNKNGKTARAGGLGFMFSDEGSGFWLAVETIKLAIKEQDQIIEKSGLQNLVLDFFKVRQIRELTNSFYNHQISRDQIASFAAKISQEAQNKNEVLDSLIKQGAESLVENVRGTAINLDFTDRFSVSVVGGMFRGNLLKKFFIENLRKKIPNADFVETIFPPSIGAVLLAYRQTNIESNKQILSKLRITYDGKNSEK